MFEISQGRHKRADEYLGGGGAHRRVAITGDRVMSGQRWTIGRTALSEDLEEHSESTPRAIEFALHHGEGEQLIVARMTAQRLVASGEPQLHSPIDAGEPFVGGLEMLRAGGVGSILRP